VGPVAFEVRKGVGQIDSEDERRTQEIGEAKPRLKPAHRDKRADRQRGQRDPERQPGPDAPLEVGVVGETGAGSERDEGDDNAAEWRGSQEAESEESAGRC